MKNKLGKFTVDGSMLRDPEMLAKVFTIMKFVPTRAEFMYLNNTMNYEGYSDLFDECPEHQVIPNYIISITVEPNKFAVGVARID